MTNILLSQINLVDSTTAILSSSSHAGDLSIENVIDPRIGKRWRCEGPSDYGQVDFGADVDIDIVALAFPRDTALATGTVQHQFDADGGTPGTGAIDDSGAIDLGLADGYGYHVYRPANTISARYWRWTYALTSPFADTGRAWAGATWEPAVNISYGAAEEWGDLSVVTTSARSGAEFVDERLRLRAYSFTLGFMAEEDKLIARELKRIVGISKQLLIVKVPDESDVETIIGRLREVNPILTGDYNLYATLFNVRESL
jgi:hypothetical protein